MMKKAKQKMLEKKGWKVGTAEEFLGLSPVESRCIELKLTMSECPLARQKQFLE
jgi:hypothetical protein